MCHKEWLERYWKAWLNEDNSGETCLFSIALDGKTREIEFQGFKYELLKQELSTSQGP